MTEFYFENLRTAKKMHTCEMCGRSILPKDKYITISAVTDGEFYYIKRCCNCQKLVNFCETNWCADEYYDYDGIDYDYQENVCKNCTHYMNNNDDCEYNTFQCPYILDYVESPHIGGTVTCK